MKITDCKCSDAKSFTLDEMIRDYRYHKNPILHFVILKFNLYKNIFSDFKWRWKNRLQLLFRGYSDSECWNLPQTMCKFLLPRIKHLRKKYASLSNRNHLMTLDGNIVPYKPRKQDIVYSDKAGGYVDKSLNGKDISLNQEEYEFVLDEIIFAIQLIVDEETLDVDLYKKYEVYPDGYDGERHMHFTKANTETGEKIYDVKFKGGIKPDFSKMELAYERQRKGFILLGLYFKDLWD